MRRDFFEPRLKRACVVPCSQSQMAGIRGSWRGGMFACDVAMAFAGVTSRGLPGVLIKITSGSSHMLILGALKDDANTSACSWEVGEGGLRLCSTVWVGCVFVGCGCARVSARPCFCERNCNRCWGGGRDSRGGADSPQRVWSVLCGHEEMLTIGLCICGLFILTS